MRHVPYVHGAHRRPARSETRVPDEETKRGEVRSRRVFFAIRVGFRVKRRGEEMRDSKRAAFARRFRA
jgi:hypothetical protein